MGNVAEKQVDSVIMVDGKVVAVLFPLNEAEFSDEDFALCEMMNIYSEEHGEALKMEDIMEMMQTDDISDVYRKLEHLQEVGAIAYAPKMPNPIVIVRGM